MPEENEEIIRVSKAERASMKVCIFGSGRFGTAMGTVIARNGYPVTLLTRRDLVAESINKTHIHPLVEDYKLPELFTATTSAAEAIRDADFIVHAIPVQSTFEFLEPLRDLIPADVPIVSTSKGLKTDTLEMMSDLIPRALGRPQAMAFLSGPTFAQELMEGYPSGAVLASENARVAARCRALFNCAALRCYTTSDVVGVEMGGAL
jgi:glycerol-3-phosphate dehydrogenase (NAD+)